MEGFKMEENKKKELKESVEKLSDDKLSESSGGIGINKKVKEMIKNVGYGALGAAAIAAAAAGGKLYYDKHKKSESGNDFKPGNEVELDEVNNN